MTKYLFGVLLLGTVWGQDTPVPDPGERSDTDAQKAEHFIPQPPPRVINLPPPPPGPNDFVMSSDVDIVLLDVSVKDPKGGYVSGLEKPNFTITEDGKPQEIRIFAKQDVPVTVGLVVDNSASVRPKRAEIVTASLAFAKESHPQDEFFVVNFNDRIRMGLPKDKPFTDSLPLLRDALLNNPVQGRTALYDGLQAAMAHLQNGARDKKTLVLIADGGDNASRLSEEELLRTALESRATIYTIGIYNPDDKDRNPGFLKKLANITGGEYFEPQELNELTSIAVKIAKDIRNRYTVGYTPANDRYDGKVRKIRLEAHGPEKRKLDVRTRTQYIASDKRAKTERTRAAK